MAQQIHAWVRSQPLFVFPWLGRATRRVQEVQNEDPAGQARPANKRRLLGILPTQGASEHSDRPSCGVDVHRVK